MTIYANPKGHRQIYEKHYGAIPREPNGRSYEIHHIDSDHFNNELNNLKLVTIQEHYDIHYSQGDWHACLLIAQRMELSPEIKSNLCSRATKELFAKGTHPFIDGKLSKEVQKRRIEDGTHHMLGGTIQSNTQKRLLAEGRQNFKQPGFISSSHIRLSCLLCRRNIGLAGFSQHYTSCTNKNT